MEESLFNLIMKEITYTDENENVIIDKEFDPTTKEVLSEENCYS